MKLTMGKGIGIDGLCLRDPKADSETIAERLGCVSVLGDIVFTFHNPILYVVTSASCPMQNTDLCALLVE